MSHVHVDEASKMTAQHLTKLPKVILQVPGAGHLYKDKLMKEMSVDERVVDGIVEDGCFIDEDGGWRIKCFVFKIVVH